jgi:hypothetical protein
MKFSNINEKITLLANFGVLTGIIFLAYEIRQTQIVITADTHSARTQRSIDIGMWQEENDVNSIVRKLQGDMGISEKESNIVRRSVGILMRHAEDLHFQRQLGLIEDELWKANEDGLRAIVNSTPFDFTYPNWPSSSPSFFRESFHELLISLKE